MKKFLLTALTLLGLATQTVAAPFVEGEAYKLKHNASDLYFNMEIDGLGDGYGTHCASLQAKANASTVFFVKNPDNENQWQIRVNTTDGPNLSSDSSWHSIINSSDGYYWSVTEYDDNTVTFERTTYATTGRDNYLGPNHSANGYSAGNCLWSNQDGGNANKLAACKFQVIALGSATDIFEAALNADNITLAQNMALIKNIIGDTEMPSVSAPDDLTVENAEAKAAEVNTAITNYLNAFNGKRITIASTRRTNNPYLAAIPTGNSVKMNTQAAISPDAVWEIVMQTAGFKLYSRTTGQYITLGGGVYFPKTNGDGIALAYGNGDNGLNVDNSINNLTTWGSSDDGSRWNIAPAEYDFAAPEVSTADVPKYYRIVNARWMYEKASPCMGAQGQNQSANGIGEKMTRAQAAIPGVYWRIESVDGDNGVKLVNLVGYELTIGNEASNNYVTLTESGSTFYLHKQTAEQFAGIEECYAIASGSEVNGDNCLDATNYDPRGAKIIWNPTQDNNGHGNNGSLWYFIPATEAEIATATSTYIANVKARIVVPKVDESLAALLGEEYVNDLYEQVAIPTFETVAEVNAEKASPGDYTSAIDAIKTAVKSKFAEATLNKNVLLRNCNPDYSNCYMTKGTFTPTGQEAYDAIVPTAGKTNVDALWAFDFSEGQENVLKLRNVNSSLYIGVKDANNQAQPLTEEGFEYVVDYNPNVPGFSFLANGQDAINGIHQSNNNVICRWNIENIAGSHWSVIALAECPVSLQQSSASGHVLTFSGVTLNEHESAADLKITITKRAEESDIQPASLEPDAEGVFTISAADITDGEVSLSGISEGIYDVNVPAGMFVDSEGMPTGSYKDSFSVASDGTTTGIEEIVTDPFAGQTVIYDLQGRRLSAPVKGINIINGKKVLVK